MDTIKHRGPSSDGKYTNDQVALGFRRLSIIDLRGGSQPIFNEDKSRAIIFNGEIYNYRKLRDRLLAEKKVTAFRSTSDTEVLLEAFEAYGVKETIKTNARECLR